MAINVEKFADEVEAKIGAEEAQLVRDLQSEREGVTRQAAHKAAQAVRRRALIRRDAAITGRTSRIAGGELEHRKWNRFR